MKTGIALCACLRSLQNYCGPHCRQSRPSPWRCNSRSSIQFTYTQPAVGTHQLQWKLLHQFQQRNCQWSLKTAVTVHVRQLPTLMGCISNPESTISAAIIRLVDFRPIKCLLTLEMPEMASLLSNLCSKNSINFPSLLHITYSLVIAPHPTPMAPFT